MFPLILVIILLVGILIFTLYIRRNPFDELPAREKPGECTQADGDCGTCVDLCAAQRVLKAETAAPADFGDDCLDAFAGTASDKYTDEQTALFAETLESLAPADVAAWMESLRRRGIALPASLRDEALMLLEEN